MCSDLRSILSISVASPNNEANPAGEGSTLDSSAPERHSKVLRPIYFWIVETQSALMVMPCKPEIPAVEINSQSEERKQSTGATSVPVPRVFGIL